jgi:hypothetical protein
VLGPVDAATGRDADGEPARVPLDEVARGAVEVELSRATNDDTDEEG